MPGETKFRQKAREELGKRGFLSWSVESHQNSVGIPDLHYIMYGVGHSGWIELKAEEKMPRRIDLRPAQIAWLERYAEAHGTAFVLLKAGEKMYIADGSFARDLAGGDLSSLVALDGWPGLASHLISARSRA